MKKKILIGSIIAVAIIILVSFTSVVGYQTVKSNFKITSPLFNVRTNKAVNKEKNTITSNFVGKDGKISIILPTRNDNNLEIQKIIEMISEMSNEEFVGFIDSITERLSNDDNEMYYDKEKIKSTINQLMDNPNRFNYLQATLKKTKVQSETFSTDYCTIFQPFPNWCIGEFFIQLIVEILISIAMLGLIIFSVRISTCVFNNDCYATYAC